METGNHAYRQTVLGNLVFKEDASADSEGGGTGGPDPPPPWKITSHMGFYRE